MKKFFAFLLVFFTTQSVFAEFVCDINVIKYSARYAPNSYTCQNEQFLPANAIACVSCPNDLTCPGGTFDFNPDIFQGISFTSVPSSTMNNICAANFPTKLHAKYAPNSHKCSPGYYLPANVDECTQCTAGNICSGGTYSFNETTDQGIVACDVDTYSPTGSAVCYQHILHVGNDNIYLRSTKQTTPSLNIQIDENIFYANMTTTPTYMNKDSSHYLHILYEGDDYYVCDDTTYVAPSE